MKDVAVTEDNGKGAGGRADASVRFRDLVSLLKTLGFEERIKGDRHVFTREGFVEIINLQPKGSNSKPYQVKQVRELILRCQLRAIQ